jgi:hypothetical protein
VSRRCTPGLKPRICNRNVLAGLKTRFPELKSGAGTNSLHPSEQAAEGVRTGQERRTQGLFSPTYSQSLTAQLKSCPDTKQGFSAACKAAPDPEPTMRGLSKIRREHNQTVSRCCQGITCVGNLRECALRVRGDSHIHGQARAKAFPYLLWLIRRQRSCRQN